MEAPGLLDGNAATGPHVPGEAARSDASLIRRLLQLDKSVVRAQPETGMAGGVAAAR